MQRPDPDRGRPEGEASSRLASSDCRTSELLAGYATPFSLLPDLLNPIYLIHNHGKIAVAVLHIPDRFIKSLTDIHRHLTRIVNDQAR
jgi:hypothetical protein